jgi:hypothetical protein
MGLLVVNNSTNSSSSSSTSSVVDARLSGGSGGVVGVGVIESEQRIVTTSTAVSVLFHSVKNINIATAGRGTSGGGAGNYYVAGVVFMISVIGLLLYVNLYYEYCFRDTCFCMSKWRACFFLKYFFVTVTVRRNATLSSSSSPPLSSHSSPTTLAVAAATAASSNRNSTSKNRISNNEKKISDTDDQLDQITILNEKLISNNTNNSNNYNTNDILS